MNNVYDRLMFVSSRIHRDIVALYNEIDYDWKYYVFISMTLKGNAIHYNELTGIDITQEVSSLNDMSFDPEAFIVKLEKKSIDAIKFETNKWYWLKSQ